MPSVLRQMHRDVVVPILFHMLPVGEFLDFAATATFADLQASLQAARNRRYFLIQGIASILHHGLALPWFAHAVIPTLAIDPLLLPMPIHRYQRLWQIHDEQAIHDMALVRHGMDPFKMLRYENRNVHGHYPLVQSDLKFLAEQCSNFQIAFWDSVCSVALPWPLKKLYPKLPQIDGLNVDYVIIYFQYKNIGACLCFWSTFPPASSPSLRDFSDDEDSSSSSPAGQDSRGEEPCGEPPWVDGP